MKAPKFGWQLNCSPADVPEVIMQYFSRHARLRCAQRSVPSEHIDLALDWGRPIRQRHGRVAWHLGDREANEARNTGVPIPERAIGVTVVLAADNTVVTVVRSHDRHRLTTHGGRSRQGGGAGGAR